MRKTLFLIFAMLLAMAVKAQDFKDFYTFDKINNTVEFDISKISLFEQRVHFVYLLHNDDRFNVSTSDKDGIFIIKRNNDSYNFNLNDVFQDFYNEENMLFSSMSKDEIGEKYSEWKSSLPNSFIASMMMEVYVRDRQNNHCATADPFCTDNGMYQFPAGVNAGSGETGPNYSCLTTTPNPAWYYMRMANSGGMTIYMYSTPSQDIDFCCWGPFDDPTSPCPNGLTGGKVVSCSYSSSATENCIIPNTAQTGQYYILVITNYSNHSCNINFSKTAGSGTTDCSILEPFLTANTPCYGSNLVLEANVIEGASYTWTSPDNQTHNGRTWTRQNATLAMAGTYTCQVVAGTQSGNESINVYVLPNVTANFTATEAVVGDPVQFTGTETTTPSGHTSEINVRHWNFGDGTTSTSVNPTHTYSTPGDYQVTYTVAITGGDDGECGDTKTTTIQIRHEFNASVASDGASFCDGDAVPNLTATATGGYGNYTYSWTASPACQIDYPNSATTTAHPAVGTTTFTCEISDGHSTLTKSVSVTVNPIPDATITGPNPPHVNYAATTTLSVPEMQGATYEWSSDPANLVQSGQGTHQIQTASLTVPTTFYVTVSKNGCSDNSSFTIAVGDALFGTVEITGLHELCSGETTSLKVTPSGGTEQYTYDWQPADKIEGANNTQSITTKELTSSLSFTCTITDTDNHTYSATSNTIVVNPIPEANAYISDNGTTYKTYNILAGNQVLLSMNEIAGATYSWEPANLINNFLDESHRIAKTISMAEGENVEFTATVTSSSGCTNQDNLVVNVYQALDESYLSASNTSTCEDFEVILTANPVGGTGNFSYHWTPESYYSDPYSQTTTVYPNSDIYSYSCTITDEGIDDHANNRITKDISIGILEKPSVNHDLIGRDYVEPGVDYMPYIYEYNIQVSSLHGYDIENAEYEWVLACYYDTPNHIAGPTGHETSWQVYGDPDDKNKAYVSVDEEGNALLTCTLTTECGTTVTQRFIYTSGYGEGASVDEVDYDKMITLYPNPSTGELYIGYNDYLISAPLTISIYSYSGMLVDQFKADASTNVTRYSMDGYTNGLYLIKINGNDFVVTKKLVLNK